MTEGLILSLIFSAALLLLALFMRRSRLALPVVFISSIGWTVSGLQCWQQTEEALPMILLIFMAFSQLMLIKGED